MGTELSVVVTLHNEGALAAACLCSVRDALMLNDTGAEVILVNDCASQETRRISQYFASQDSRFRVLDVECADPALSRNAGINSSAGEFVALIDGDDLISESYLHDLLYTAISVERNTVIRPELIVTFGEEHSLTHQADERFVEISNELLFEVNPWASPALARRSVFLDVPYRQLLSVGFGYEDWAWNCDLRAQGFRNVVAQGAAYFYRRKNPTLSRNARAISGASLLPPQDLFSIRFAEE